MDEMKKLATCKHSRTMYRVEINDVTTWCMKHDKRVWVEPSGILCDGCTSYQQNDQRAKTWHDNDGCVGTLYGCRGSILPYYDDDPTCINNNIQQETK